ncbi:hypothetical protein BT63DRAFT_453544 [Microthyrium microscopicum]|uniref:Uncharacterized protein n=1 Tax=Microthyrium microscopicum TaxID=703497 RepID=A0A6A6UJB4_9PEZI|nr:hypothetical protein BT63DRAFT_453544 [Microthyrium microscopicum]
MARRFIARPVFADKLTTDERIKINKKNRANINQQVDVASSSSEPQIIQFNSRSPVSLRSKRSQRKRYEYIQTKLYKEVLSYNHELTEENQLTYSMALGDGDGPMTDSSPESSSPYSYEIHRTDSFLTVLVRLANVPFESEWQDPYELEFPRPGRNGPAIYGGAVVGPVFVIIVKVSPAAQFGPGEKWQQDGNFQSIASSQRGEKLRLQSQVIVNNDFIRVNMGTWSSMFSLTVDRETGQRFLFPGFVDSVRNSQVRRLE